MPRASTITMACGARSSGPAKTGKRFCAAWCSTRASFQKFGSTVDTARWPTGGITREQKGFVDRRRPAAIYQSCAGVSRDRGAKDLIETLVHTGQHFDHDMSDIFFVELGIRKPDHTLGIHGGSHGEMTGRMIIALEHVMLKEQPDAVLIYGDTNSTLAGAIAAAKLYIPIAHVEAGLRSFQPMPEEINRVLADRVSRWLFCPTATAVANLEREGSSSGVHDVGDVMYDATIMMRARARNRSTILSRLGLAPGEFQLATLHRAENTDTREALERALAYLRAGGAGAASSYCRCTRVRARLPLSLASSCR